MTKLHIFPLATLMLLAAAPYAAGEDFPSPDYEVSFTDASFIGQRDTAIEFTRSTTAWTFDRTGNYVPIPANTPRIAYNPYLCESDYKNIVQHPNCARRPLGVLVEEARVNLLSQSGLSDGGNWILAGLVLSQGPSKTPSDSVAARLSLKGNNARGSLRQRLVMPKEGTLAISMYTQDVHPALVYDLTTTEPTTVDKPARFRIKVSSLDSNGAVKQRWTTGLIDTRHQILDPGSFLVQGTEPKDFPGATQPLDGSWVRTWIRTPQPLPQGPVEVELILEASKSSKDRNLDVWGIQAEIGEFPTSYIPTKNTPVSRDADQLVINPGDGAPEFEWYDPSQGTFVVEAVRQFDSPQRFSYLFDKRGSGVRQVVGIRNRLLQLTQKNGKQIQQILGPGLPTNEIFRLSAGYTLSMSGAGASSTSMMVNGGDLLTRDHSEDLGGAAPKNSAPASLTVGYITDPTYERHLNGAIAKISYYKTHLSEDQQRQVTALGSISNIRSSIGDLVPDLSDECEGPLQIGLTQTKWLSKNGQLESHILSRRFPQNIVVTAGPSDARGEHSVCRFKTEKNADSVRSGWTTGSMQSDADQRYGYFEADYIVNGVTQDSWLNNAFWLMRMVTKGERAARSNINFEIDINEGKVPNRVHATFHLHNYVTTPSGAKLHPYSTGLWFAPRGTDMNKRYERFALLWNVQELIWLWNGAIYRRMPNYSAHNHAKVYFSTAILKAGKSEEIPDTLNGMNVDLNYIRTHLLKSQ